jgi:hypothetical protein
MERLGRKIGASRQEAIMEPTHVEEQPAHREQKKRAAWNHKTVKILVVILISSLVLTPVIGYQVKKWPWQNLADGVLKNAPDVRRLKITVSPVAVVDPPGFVFDYETHSDSVATHRHFNDRLGSLGFERKTISWQDGDRTAYFYSAHGQVACNIYWRNAENACAPGYRRRNCDPSVNVVFGSCQSTSQQKSTSYERFVVGIVVGAVFTGALAVKRMLEALKTALDIGDK